MKGLIINLFLLAILTLIATGCSFTWINSMSENGSDTVDLKQDPNVAPQVEIPAPLHILQEHAIPPNRIFYTAQDRTLAFLIPYDRGRFPPSRMSVEGPLAHQAVLCQ